LNRGGKMPSVNVAAIEKLVKRALRQRSERLYTITRRGGWHGDSYVDFEETFGRQAGSLIFDWRELKESCRKGSFKAWRRQLMPACTASSYLTFVIAVAFAAPLLDIIGEEESSLFYLHGRESGSDEVRKLRSSTGKTTALRAMNSTMDSAAIVRLKPFRMTERGFAENCAKRNDRAVGFDEAARTANTAARRKEMMANIAYAIASGVGKVISEKVAQDVGLPNLTWRTMAVGTGELPPDLDTIREEGEQLRFIGIVVPPGDSGGVFDRLASGQNAKDLLDTVKVTITENSGVALPRHLSKIVPMRPRLAKRARKEVEDFCQSVGAVDVPWEYRFASRFGIVLAGAVIAAELEVAPWTVKHARRSILRIYRRARKAVASKSSSVDALLAGLREAGRAGKFPIVERGKGVPKSARPLAMGIRRTHPRHGKLLAIPRKRLAELVQPRVLARAVISDLAKKGAVVRAGDGNLTHQIKVKGLGGSRGRFVCFRMSALREKAQ
jgi:putative DNA primase/helicase